MKKIPTLFTLFISIFLTLQAQQIDPGFAPLVTVNASTRHVIVQPDGKLLVSGNFRFAEGQPVGPMVRLNDDGGYDPGFRYPFILQEVPDAFDLTAEGKVIIAGRFRNEDGSIFANLLRLHPDGQIDHDFQPFVDRSISGITDVQVLPNGKILLSFFGQAEGSPIRLFHPDGRPDGQFQADIADEGVILDIDSQSDNAL